MPITLDEVYETKRLIAEVAASLKKDGLPHKADIPIGVMVEVPSTAIMADVIAREIDFFSIGTNDLIQYTMAIDRGNRYVAYLYNPLTPSVLRLIKHVAEAGLRHNIPVFMCGEMAGEPLYAPILLGMGLQELSTNPQAIPIIKNAIRMLSQKESSRFLDKVLEQTTVEQIENMVRDTYGDLLNNGVLYKPWEQ